MLVLIPISLESGVPDADTSNLILIVLERKIEKFIENSEMLIACVIKQYIRGIRITKNILKIQCQHINIPTMSSETHTSCK